MDLSKIHEQITHHFERPMTSDQWAKYKLTPEQVEFYMENGYLHNIPMFDAAIVEVLKSQLEELMREGDHPLFHEVHSNQSTTPGQTLYHALGAWRIKPVLHDVLFNPRFVMASYQLLGGGVRFWHDQLFCKPARHGGVVAWHQDYSYWTRTVPMQHLTCWTGLDDSTQENGCLWYVPGSHRWDLLEMPEIAGDMDGISEFLTDTQKENFNPIPIEMKAGYATFHHPLMIHGSYENKSDRPRRGLVVNVFKDGTMSDSSDPLLKGVPVVPVGEKLDNQFFPLLTKSLTSVLTTSNC